MTVDLTNTSPIWLIMRRLLILVMVVTLGPLSDAQAQTRELTGTTVARLQALTTNGTGLVPTALSDARTIGQHARQAAYSDDAATARTHAVEIARAMNRTAAADADARFGLIPALRRIISELDALRLADTAKDVSHSAPRAIAAAQNALRIAEELALTAERIEASRTAEPSDFAGLLQLSRQLIAGADASKRIGAITGAPDGGLLAIQWHLGVLQAQRQRVVPTSTTKPAVQR